MTTDDQGSWTSDEIDEGFWSNSGSGSFTVDVIADASYSGSGSFTATGVVTGSGTIWESGNQHYEDHGVSHYDLDASGEWQWLSGSGSGEQSGSTSWSYSGSGSYTDTSFLAGQEHASASVVSDYDMDAAGNWVLIDESSPSPDISGSSGIAFFQSGSVPTGSSVVGLAFTWGAITSDDQGNWTAEEVSEGDWSYSGSGSTTLNGTWDVSYGPENAVAGPLVQPGTFYTQQDTTLNADASEGVLAGASIPQGVTVSVSLVSGPSHGSLTLYSDGSFDYEPDSGWFGTDTFVVQLTDGTLTSAPMTETIEVSQVISLANNDFRAVVTGDFDDDGNADFVAANYSTAEVYVFLGNGDGTFQTPTAISVGYGAVALAVADLGNGTLDIVVVNSSDGTVTILFNDGNGSFTTSQTLSLGNDPSAVAVGDFLGNGRVDLAVANQGDDTISLFANDGSGSFTLDSTVNVGTEPAALAAVDLNDDGADDLVVANSGDGTIAVLLNTGSGGFTTPVSYTVGTSPRALVVADFDDDGNLDVAVANSGSDSVSVLLGNGEGTLEDAVSYAVGTTPVDLVVWVGNTAGVPDLLVANQGSDDLTILFNNGFGAFTDSQSIPLGHSPDAVAVADFDNDGLADYVADGELEVAQLRASLLRPPSCMTCHGRMDSSGRIDFRSMSEAERIQAARWLGITSTDPRVLERYSDRITAFGPTEFATGVGQGAGHIATHPWQIVTGPARFGYGMFADKEQFMSESLEVLKGAVERPARTGGGVVGAGVVTAGLVKGTVGLVKAAPVPVKAGLRKIQSKIAPKAARPFCFAAGTPLLTPTGAKAVEEFQPGDLILSRAETNPEGGIEAKAVEEVFIRVAPILQLHVAGRIIRTTVEHPFWVVGKGWLPAGFLEPGMLLTSHDDCSIRVDQVTNNGEVATVYNLRVADYHTYFVGCQEWGFSVWAHNTCFKVVELKNAKNQVIGYEIRGPKGELVSKYKKTEKALAEKTANRLNAHPATTPKPIRVSENWQPRRVDDPACRVGCEGVAKQIQNLKGGTIHQINSPIKDGPLGKFMGHDAGWKYHEVVVHEGRVYDIFTGSQGMPIAEYKALWEHGSVLNFGF